MASAPADALVHTSAADEPRLPFLLVFEAGAANFIEEHHATEASARASANAKWYSFVLFTQSQAGELTELCQGGLGFGHGSIRRHVTAREDDLSSRSTGRNGSRRAMVRSDSRSSNPEVTADMALTQCIALPAEDGHVTAMHSDGEEIVLGTSLGRLLLCTRDGDVASRCVLGGRKGTRASSRSVRAVHVLGRARIVVALCDGLATVHALDDSLLELCCLNNSSTRAEAICCHEGDAGSTRLPCVALAVAAQSCLLLYRLSNPIQLYRELPVPAAPAQILWDAGGLTLISATGVTVMDEASGAVRMQHDMASHLAPTNERHATATAYENQRWMPMRGFSAASLLPTDRCGGWSDGAGRTASSRAALPLPREGARWAGEWTLDLAGTRDADGWRYASSFSASTWHLENGRALDARHARRRTWVRRYVLRAAGHEEMVGGGEEGGGENGGVVGVDDTDKLSSRDDDADADGSAAALAALSTTSAAHIHAAALARGEILVADSETSEGSSSLTLVGVRGGGETAREQPTSGVTCALPEPLLALAGQWPLALACLPSAILLVRLYEPRAAVDEHADAGGTPHPQRRVAVLQQLAYPPGSPGMPSMLATVQAIASERGPAPSPTPSPTPSARQLLAAVSACGTYALFAAGGVVCSLPLATCSLLAAPPLPLPADATVLPSKEGNADAESAEDSARRQVRRLLAPTSHESNALEGLPSSLLRHSLGPLALSLAEAASQLEGAGSSSSGSSSARATLTIGLASTRELLRRATHTLTQCVLLPDASPAREGGNPSASSPVLLTDAEEEEAALTMLVGEEVERIVYPRVSRHLLTLSAASMRIDWPRGPPLDVSDGQMGSVADASSLDQLATQLRQLPSLPTPTAKLRALAAIVHAIDRNENDDDEFAARPSRVALPRTCTPLPHACVRLAEGILHAALPEIPSELYLMHELMSSALCTRAEGRALVLAQLAVEALATAEVQRLASGGIDGGAGGGGGGTSASGGAGVGASGGSHGDGVTDEACLGDCPLGIGQPTQYDLAKRTLRRGDHVYRDGGASGRVAHGVYVGESEGKQLIFFRSVDGAAGADPASGRCCVWAYGTIDEFVDDGDLHQVRTGARSCVCTRTRTRAADCPASSPRPPLPGDFSAAHLPSQVAYTTADHLELSVHRAVRAVGELWCCALLGGAHMACWCRTGSAVPRPQHLLAEPSVGGDESSARKAKGRRRGANAGANTAAAALIGSAMAADEVATVAAAGATGAAVEAEVLVGALGGAAAGIGGALAGVMIVNRVLEDDARLPKAERKSRAAARITGAVAANAAALGSGIAVLAAGEVGVGVLAGGASAVAGGIAVAAAAPLAAAVVLVRAARTICPHLPDHPDLLVPH